MPTVYKHCRHELVRAKNSTDKSVPTIFEPSGDRYTADNLRRGIMALTEHLTIYKSAHDLCLYIEQVVRNFSRYHKYSLGADLRDGAREVLKLVLRQFKFGNWVRPSTSPSIDSGQAQGERRYCVTPD